MVYDKDITIMYVQATSFPDGIMPAYEKLHRYVPFTLERKFISMSRPEDGEIIYRAGAEELYPGEAQSFGLAAMTLKKGRYLCITVYNFMEDVPAVGRAFDLLTEQPGIDPQGYCVEWYFNEPDVHCMVRLAD